MPPLTHSCSRLPVSHFSFPPFRLLSPLRLSRFNSNTQSNQATISCELSADSFKPRLCCLLLLTRARQELQPHLARFPLKTSVGKARMTPHVQQARGKPNMPASRGVPVSLLHPITNALFAKRKPFGWVIPPVLCRTRTFLPLHYRLRVSQHASQDYCFSR